MADILRVLALYGAARKMSIVYKANLNFNRIGKYLHLLVETGHVEIVTSRSGSDSYKITGKGQDFLSAYDRLVESLTPEEQSQILETRSEDVVVSVS